MKYVYCTSLDSYMLIQTINSAKTLSRFADKEDIIFIINPVSEETVLNAEILKNYGNPVLGDKFIDYLDIPPFKYKSQVGDIDDDVLFMDSDTLVLNDPSEIINKEAEAAASEEHGYDNEVWQKILTMTGNPKDLKHYHDGIFYLKNEYSSEVTAAWLSYWLDFLRGKIPWPMERKKGSYTKENELAFSLAIGGLNIQELDHVHQHRYGWLYPLRKKNLDDTYIYHIGTRGKLDNLGYFLNLSQRVEQDVVEELDLITLNKPRWYI